MVGSTLVGSAITRSLVLQVLKTVGVRFLARASSTLKTVPVWLACCSYRHRRSRCESGLQCFEQFLASAAIHFMAQAGLLGPDGDAAFVAQHAIGGANVVPA